MREWDSQLLDYVRRERERGDLRVRPCSHFPVFDGPVSLTDVTDKVDVRFGKDEFSSSYLQRFFSSMLTLRNM